MISFASALTRLRQKIALAVAKRSSVLRRRRRAALRSRSSTLHDRTRDESNHRLASGIEAAGWTAITSCLPPCALLVRHQTELALTVGAYVLTHRYPSLRSFRMSRQRLQPRHPHS